MPSNLGELSEVRLKGKITRAGVLKYTPAGIPLIELTLAVPQAYLESRTVGYYPLLCDGELAERMSGKLRVGQKVFVSGRLWSREYKNRQGHKVSEFYIVAEEIRHEGGKNEEVR